MTSAQSMQSQLFDVLFQFIDFVFQRDNKTFIKFSAKRKTFGGKKS